MSYIQNIQKINDNLIHFDFNNESTNLKTSLINAIRRVVMSEIETYAIDVDQITIHENRSVMDNEFLKHRLMLIPIFSRKNIDYDSLLIRCNKRNDEEDIVGVYVEDFEIVNTKNNRKINIQDVFPYLRTLVLKLKYNEMISFDCKLKKSTSLLDGSAYLSVCTCLHKFGITEEDKKQKMKDMTDDEKKIFLTRDIERAYSLNTNGDPLIYNFILESIGQLDPKTILLESIQKLKEKINLFITNLVDHNEELVKIENGEVFENIFTIVVNEETETLGNLLSDYVGLDENVSYSGYVLKHPLYRKIILRCLLKNDNTEENVIEVYKQTVKKINDILDDIYQNISTFN